MHRPTFLIAENEPPEGISTRKLVLETAKFNVITAYSGAEAIYLFEKFPELDAVVVHSSLEQPSAHQVVEEIRDRDQDILIIFLVASAGQHSRFANHHVSSHEPHDLLALLQTLFGDPRLPATRA